MTVAADWDVKLQIIKLFVRIQHVSYLPFMPNEMSGIGPVHIRCWAVFVMFIQTLYLANCGDPDQTANHATDQFCLSISQNKGGLTRPIQALLPLDK